MTEELQHTIMLTLQVDGQWVGHFDADDRDGIAHARAAARKAGRALKIRVRTVQTDPNKRDDHKVVVVALVNEEPPAWKKEEDFERARHRTLPWL